MELLGSLRSMLIFIFYWTCPICVFFTMIYAHRTMIGDYPRFYTFMMVVLFCMFYMFLAANKIDNHYCYELGTFEKEQKEWKGRGWKQTKECQHSKFGKTKVASIIRKSSLCLLISTLIVCWIFVNSFM